MHLEHVEPTLMKDNPVNSSISPRGLLVALLRSDMSIQLPIPLTRILSGAHT